jgi:membrane protease subunit HflC
LLIGLILASLFCYTVQETQQAIITQFGRPIGQPITEAGLHFKTPFVQQVNYLEKRVMEWDGAPEQAPTKDKLFIVLDTYARWRISDPLLFFQTLRDEISAQSRLDDILDGEVRNAVARHPLIELVRTDKGRVPVQDAALTSSGVMTDYDWQPIELGRAVVANEINKAAREKLKTLGIELIDLRFKRLNYNPDVQNKIYDRMISERQQIAEKFRSQGQGEAARILGEKERDLRKIESEAYRKIQEIRGKADAQATDIYAKAYNQSPAAYEFYQFQKTMETYLTTLDKSTMLVLSTQGDFFKFLKTVDAGAPAVPGAAH